MPGGWALEEDGGSEATVPTPSVLHWDPSLLGWVGLREEVLRMFP